MKSNFKTLLLTAGLLLVVCAFGIFAAGGFLLMNNSHSSPGGGDSGHYTAALSVVANSGISPAVTPKIKPTPGSGGYLAGSNNMPTNAVIRPTQPARTPAPLPSPTPAPTAPPPLLPMGSVCRFTSGPRAGQTRDYSGRWKLPLDSPCTDGNGSAGTVVLFAATPTPTPGRPPIISNTNISPGALTPAAPAPLPSPSPYLSGGSAEDHSYRYASTVKPAGEPLPPATAAPQEKDNVDMCYPVTMAPGEGRSVILRLIRTLQPLIDDFCPTSPNIKKAVKESLPLSSDNAAANKLLKDFCLTKGENYEPRVFAKLNSSTFKVDTDQSRQIQSLLEPHQEWDFNIKPENDVEGEQELSFSLRVDCVNRHDKNDLLQFPLPSSPAFKIDVQKKTVPWVEMGTINIAGLLSGLIGSVLCFPFLSERIRNWRKKFAARSKSRTRVKPDDDKDS